MHMSSLENMETCYRRYVQGTALERQPEVFVLDIGGADVNGSYRDVFSGAQFTYLGCDLAAGEGVAVVLEDPYKIPLDDSSVDIVVSGQMLEHCEFFWLSFAEMIRVLKPNGYLFLITPSAGKIHRYPVDCYRFYPDAYRALAKYANCQLVDVWLDDRGPWKDLVGVFRRHPRPTYRNAPRPAKHVYDIVAAPPGTEEEEATRGERRYLDILAELHERLSPSLYLEIGIRHGRSLALARGPAVGIDPQPNVSVELPPSTRLIQATSDQFFSAEPSALAGPIELAFIDGMHLFEYVLRDLMNVERHSSPHTLVVVDDVFPSHPAQGERDRRTRVWTGDVWKIMKCLQKYRPDLFVLGLDTSPTGLLLVGGLDPRNRVLIENYNPICRSMLSDTSPVPAEILDRHGVRRPSTELIAAIAETLTESRSARDKPATVVEKLRRAVA